MYSDQLLKASLWILSYSFARIKAVHDWHVKVEYYHVELLSNRRGLCFVESLERIKSKSLLKVERILTH